MRKYHTILFLGVLFFSCIYIGCKVPVAVQQQENATVPEVYSNNADTANAALISWKDYFKDPYLINLIDTALKNNQELRITLQEIEIAKNEVRAKKGEIQPSIGYKGGIGAEKAGRYTSQGAGDASTEIKPGKEMPDPLADYNVGFSANWEIDIWHKLHNAKDAAVAAYLATVEGKNFVLTNLIAEVANRYYELLALDNQLNIIRQSIKIQQNALEIVKVQKQAARATELAVQKFQAEVQKSQSMEFGVLQNIKETENNINFLLARYPQEIVRGNSDFLNTVPAHYPAGIPSQLLVNRPDIRQAEWELAAAKLDVKVAKAQFYPSVSISSVLGVQAFNPAYLVKLPESIFASLAGDIAGPLINKSAIKAAYGTANARQIQAVYSYERSILNGFIEVSNQLSNIDNLGENYAEKDHQVAALTRSIDIANDLFKAARADYLEVLMTQRDALEARLELIDLKKDQLIAATNLYKSLGGGWR